MNTAPLIIAIKKVEPYDPAIPLPAHQTLQSAGLDLYSQEDVEIEAGRIAVVRTGISIELPDGYEAQIRSRSGLAAKSSVFVLNAPGTVDADYRGEVKVILMNAGGIRFFIKKGDRIAQMVVAQYQRVELTEKDVLSGTNRGTGGLGSTGV